jgi:hypothetical protein
VEGALLAAGLLTAVIQSDGTVVAADGEVLLSPAGRPRQALSAALRPDAAAGLPGDVIAGVLAGVGFDDRDAATSVSADGSWRNGPLRGRHVPGLARHIGAAARAAHRRERIAQIDAELADLGRAAAERTEQRAGLDARTDRIDALVRAAPRTADLHAARRVAAKAAERAVGSASRAGEEEIRAREVRAAWVTELGTHQAACAHLGLPAEGEALEGAVAAARRAQDKSTQLGRELARLAS